MSIDNDPERADPEAARIGAQISVALFDLRVRQDLDDQALAAALNQHAVACGLAPTGGWQPATARHLALAYGACRRPGPRVSGTT